MRLEQQISFERKKRKLSIKNLIKETVEFYNNKAVW